MLKQNKGDSKIVGPKSTVVCEFSSLAYSLLNAGVEEEKLDWALREAKEYYRRENRVYTSKKNNSKKEEDDEEEESLESLLDQLKEALLDLKEDLENDDEEEEE